MSDGILEEVSLRMQGEGWELLDDAGDGLVALVEGKIVRVTREGVSFGGDFITSAITLVDKSASNFAILAETTAGKVELLTVQGVRAEFASAGRGADAVFRGLMSAAKDAYESATGVYSVVSSAAFAYAAGAVGGVLAYYLLTKDD